MLVISLPASDTSGSPHTQADDVEVGGIRGREALDRLSNVVGRVESSWRPATAEEGFEIVRRRLFEPLVGSDAFKQRDVSARAFADLYQSQGAEFPSECREGDYEKRIQAAYPIHPEIFDRLYTDWSTLVKFQRTRGVLRLMAAVIHSLWEKGDRNPLIPCLHPGIASGSWASFRTASAGDVRTSSLSHRQPIPSCASRSSATASLSTRESRGSSWRSGSGPSCSMKTLFHSDVACWRGWAPDLHGDARRTGSQARCAAPLPR